jgi:hypothetical protein
MRILRSSRQAALAAVLTLLAPAIAAADFDDDLGYEGRYGYLRTLEGSATLVQGGSGEREEAVVNQPVLAGDRLWVAPRSRAEVLLPDGNLLRLDGDTEVGFRRLAGSADGDDDVTVLDLVQGNVLLVVLEDSTGEDWPRVETGNASVAVLEPGVYRLTGLGDDWTAVVVRDGSVDLATGRDDVRLEAGEEARVEGARSPRAVVYAAGGEDALERWGARLDDRLARVPDVDPSLRYEAAPLAEYGSWVDVESRRAWRPRVATDWRPYWHGRWAYSPVGLVWVSYEPWGWLPYHYGTWDYAPGYGWVWFPGTRWATSWVYWHWGSEHVAWVPVGYYTRHYRVPGFRFGVYGWAGGSWDYYSNWVFCPSLRFGDRHQHRFQHDGRSWRRHSHHREVPRGLVTTDTRGITPERWGRHEEVERVLRTRPGARGTRGELADVTPFVARRGGLDPEVRKRVVADPADTPSLAGTPLAPAVADEPVQKVRRVRRTGEPAGGGKGGDDGRKPVALRPAGDEGGKDDPGRPEGVGGEGLRPGRPVAGRPERDEKPDEELRVVRPRPDDRPSGGGSEKGDPEVIRARPAPPPEKPDDDGGKGEVESRRPRPAPPAEKPGGDDEGRVELRRPRPAPPAEKPGDDEGRVELRRPRPAPPAEKSGGDDEGRVERRPRPAPPAEKPDGDGGDRGEVRRARPSGGPGTASGLRARPAPSAPAGRAEVRRPSATTLRRAPATPPSRTPPAQLRRPPAPADKPAARPAPGSAGNPRQGVASERSRGGDRPATGRSGRSGGGQSAGGGGKVRRRPGG